MLLPAASVTVNVKEASPCAVGVKVTVLFPEPVDSTAVPLFTLLSVKVGLLLYPFDNAVMSTLSAVPGALK